MDIQVRTDRHVRGDEALVEFIQTQVIDGLQPYLERLTSVSVHLSVESGARKGPPDLRALLEVRPRGHASLAVLHRAATKGDAVHGAVNDMRGVLERVFRRMDAHRKDATIRRRTA
jgi:hypothetical protein